MLIIWLPFLNSFSNQMLYHCCQVPEAFPDTSVQNGFLDENLCYKCMLDITMKHLVEECPFWDIL